LIARDQLMRLYKSAFLGDVPLSRCTVEPLDPDVANLLASPARSLQTTVLPQFVDALWKLTGPVHLMLGDRPEIRLLSDDCRPAAGVRPERWPDARQIGAPTSDARLLAAD
jgi:hypothetical protein